jgi:hypothetical protein
MRYEKKDMRYEKMRKLDEDGCSTNTVFTDY